LRRWKWCNAGPRGGRASRRRPARTPDSSIDSQVQSRGHVYPKAIVIEYGVHESGRREVIGLDIGETETEAFWVVFLRSLRERGLTGVRLAISDQHTGL